MDYLLEEYFMTIEIDKNNIHLSDNGIYDLLIHYAEKIEPMISKNYIYNYMRKLLF